MIEVGRVCVKTAGRDAGKKCVVVDVLDDNYVLIDGETRRRKCNIMHLEPLDKMIEIKKNAGHPEVAKAFEALGYGAHSPKTKQKTARPRRARKSKLAQARPAEKKEAKEKPAVKK
jgi:large subunit ribosomal protein L14e